MPAPVPLDPEGRGRVPPRGGDGPVDPLRVLDRFPDPGSVATPTRCSRRPARAGLARGRERRPEPLGPGGPRRSSARPVGCPRERRSLGRGHPSERRPPGLRIRRGPGPRHDRRDAGAAPQPRPLLSAKGNAPPGGHPPKGALSARPVSDRGPPRDRGGKSRDRPGRLAPRFGGAFPSGRCPVPSGPGPAGRQSEWAIRMGNLAHARRGRGAHPGSTAPGSGADREGGTDPWTRSASTT
ncbi:MAG: hypothetical protein AVDCRST_MAG19-2131 [uncultured Thermomicrobiales bacterium]|uniref:Uncharacterized protein n=1 Tax=uncultured Thermomicrobiales bacterium TaxID=1645740 RepID=A0A6J4UZ83_9BACT|nr:MAG: hypothetical protein AVDCRST_MAG19-2131 [uncultured Thermomicrobiales bacterium]